MNTESMFIMREFRDKYLQAPCSVLDVGSRCVMADKSKTYRRLFPPPYQYTGMDVEPGGNVDVVGYGGLEYFYDAVISGQVMEHVTRPWEWLKKLAQYYRKYICIIAPHTHKEHKHPIDTYRYFPDGMRDLFDYAGIVEVEIYKTKTLTVGIGK